MNIIRKHLYLILMLAALAIFYAIRQCQTKDVVEEITNEEVIVSNNFDFDYPHEMTMSVKYICNSIEVVTLDDGAGESYTFTTFPFYVNTYNMFVLCLMDNYVQLRNKNWVSESIDEFCDTTHWQIDKGGYAFKNKIDDGYLVANGGFYSGGSLFESYILNDSIRKYNIRIKEKEPNKQMEMVRSSLLSGYVESLNRAHYSDDFFPVKHFDLDEENHQLIISGDFHVDKKDKSINHDYYISAVLFLVKNNPYFAISLSYVEGRNIKPYTIVIKNNRDEIIADWTIDDLINQYVYMYLYSRVI